MKRPCPFQFLPPEAFMVPFLLVGALYVLSLIGCVANPSIAQSWGDGRTLDEAVLKIAKSLVEQGALQGQPVLISTHDFFDRTSGLSLPLAGLLREKMVTEMRRQGVRVILPGGSEDRLMILQGAWQRQKDALCLSMKVMKLTPEGPEAVSAESAVVPLGKIDPADLAPNLESWGGYLVRKLEADPWDQKVRTLHIMNFKIVRPEGSTPDKEGFFPEWLRTALSESRLFRALDPQREIKALSLETIRERGIDIRPVIHETASTGLTTDLLKAEAEMTGSAWVHEKQARMHIRVHVREHGGADLCSASVEIPFDLFPEGVLNPPKVAAIPPAPAGIDDSAEGLSSKGLRVDLTTTRGEARPFYHAAEEIRFVVRLNRTAHLYLFSSGPAGKATLLHPVERDGRLLQGPHPLLEAGKPLIIPDDTASYRLVAAEPFGTETVWAVASERQLDLPERLTDQWADFPELIGRIRRQGIAAANGYAEDQVALVTGK